MKRALLVITALTLISLSRASATNRASLAHGPLPTQLREARILYKKFVSSQDQSYRLRGQSLYLRASRQADRILPRRGASGLPINLLELRVRAGTDYVDHRGIVRTQQLLGADAAQRALEKSATYASHLIGSYAAERQDAKAVAVLKYTAFNQESSPSARTKVIVQQALNYLADRKVSLALGAFAEALELSPNDDANAVSLYWLALDARNQGDTDTEANYLHALVRMLQGKTETWQQSLLLKAEVLLNDGEELTRGASVGAREIIEKRVGENLRLLKSVESKSVL